MTDTTAGIQLRGALALLGEAERRVGGALEMMAASLVAGAPPEERSGQLGATLLDRDEAARITAGWIGAPDEGAMDEALSLSVRSHLSVALSLRQKSPRASRCSRARSCRARRRSSTKPGCGR